MVASLRLLALAPGVIVSCLGLVGLAACDEPTTQAVEMYNWGGSVGTGAGGSFGSSFGGAVSGSFGGSFGGDVSGSFGGSVIISSGGMFPALFGGVVQQAEHAVPIAGGTLLVSRDGRLAVAADADRDRVYLVELETQSVREIRLALDSEPGRVAEGADGRFFVLLRRAGALAVIDAETASVTDSLPICSAPRGLAYDERTNALHVACRSGRLVTLDATSLEVTRSLRLDPDLRDVVILDTDLFLTRFKSAEFLVLDQYGTVVSRTRPLASDCTTPTVAYRAVADGHGRVLVAHQVSTDGGVAVSFGSYGGSACSGGLVNGAVSLASPDQALAWPPGSVVDPVDHPLPPYFLTTVRLPRSGPFDIAVDSSGKNFAVIAPTQGVAEWGELENGAIIEDVNGTRLEWPRSGTMRRGQPVAVAFDAAGRIIVQSREPATLEFDDGQVLTLSSESQADTGLSMFYTNTSVGLACASCHPEGDEDGHTFHFTFGLRRTQSLAGGVLARAPFHWSGDLHDMGELVAEVMVKRMALPATPSAEQIAALGRWLDGIPQPPLEDELDPGAIERGRALFGNDELACANCHAGAQLTDNAPHDVGTGGEFFTPTLLGVGLRGSLFHDGCASSLSARFGICGGGDRHGKTSGLSEAEAADLVEYLRSL